MRKGFHSSTRQSGLTMIELMIAMVIGLFLTAAVLQVFVGSRVTYSMQASLARAQENGRFATEYLTRDFRQAGFQGCSVNNTLANTVTDDGSDLYDFIDLGSALEGLNNVNGTQSYDSLNPIAGTDVVTLKFADLDNSCIIDSHNPTSATLRCEANHTFQKGDILLVSDCSHSAIFQQSNTNNNGTVATIVHNTGQGTPGNCTKGLGLPVLCGNTNGTEYTFEEGSIVMKFTSYRYFIANNSFGEPSLYRQGISNSGTATLAYDSAVELVEGVENMQVLYGVDTGSDGVPDKYVTSAQVGSDFDDVTSIRLSLLVQGSQDGVVSGSQTLTFNGGTQTFNDGRLRKVFTTTIALRNRI